MNVALPHPSTYQQMTEARGSILRKVTDDAHERVLHSTLVEFLRDATDPQTALMVLLDVQAELTACCIPLGAEPGPDGAPDAWEAAVNRSVEYYVERSSEFRDAYVAAGVLQTSEQAA